MLKLNKQTCIIDNTLKLNKQTCIIDNTYDTISVQLMDRLQNFIYRMNDDQAKKELEIILNEYNEMDYLQNGINSKVRYIEYNEHGVISIHEIPLNDYYKE